SVGGGAAQGQFQGAGSLNLSRVSNRVEAAVAGESTSIEADALIVAAADESQIDSIAGEFATGGAVAAGFAAADSVIRNETSATVTGAGVVARDRLVVAAESEGTLRTLSISKSEAGGSSLHGSV